MLHDFIENGAPNQEIMFQPFWFIPSFWHLGSHLIQVSSKEWNSSLVWMLKRGSHSLRLTAVHEQDSCQTPGPERPMCRGCLRFILQPCWTGSKCLLFCAWDDSQKPERRLQTERAIIYCRGRICLFLFYCFLERLEFKNVVLSVIFYLHL